jgi:cysteine desulfurase
MGMKPGRARGCVRFSLGFYNTDEEIDYLLKHLPRVIGKLREGSVLKPGTGHATHVAHAGREGNALI